MRGGEPIWLAPVAAAASTAASLLLRILSRFSFPQSPSVVLDTAIIALGANTGDRLASLRRAALRLSALSAGALRASRVYETAPMYLDDQPTFLNAVICIRWRGQPEALMVRLLEVEEELGRVRRERFGPRVIDLDLLAVDAEVRASDLLRLPHPLLHERPFVLHPLCDVAPTWEHPLLGRSALELRDDLPLRPESRPRPLAQPLVVPADREVRSC